METKIESVIDRLYKTDGVKGVLVADQHGLCLGARGTAIPSTAGFIATIALHAGELHYSDQQRDTKGDDGESAGMNDGGEEDKTEQGESIAKITPSLLEPAPVIKIEMDNNSSILIRSDGNLTLAIFK